jgi:hypothetical protein
MPLVTGWGLPGVVMTGTSNATGRPVVSFDEGKTWQDDDHEVNNQGQEIVTGRHHSVPSVTVSFEKINH